MKPIEIKYSSKLKVWWYRLIYPLISFEGGYRYESIKCSQSYELDFKLWEALVRMYISNGWERVYMGETPFTYKAVCWLRKPYEDIL